MDIVWRDPYDRAFALERLANSLVIQAVERLKLHTISPMELLNLSIESACFADVEGENIEVG